MLRTIALLLFTMLLVACSNQQTNALSYSKVPLNRAPKEIPSYIKDLTLQASGMHQIIKNSNIFYLYLDPSFLKDGYAYDQIELKEQGNSYEVHVNQIYAPDKTGAAKAKLYKYRLNKAYEYVRFYKDGKETSVSIMGY